MYEFTTENVYEDFSSDKQMFGFSNYSTKSKYYDNSNKLNIGKMKDETGGVAIEEYVGLKPKMYSFLVDNIKKEKAWIAMSLQQQIAMNIKMYYLIIYV